MEYEIYKCETHGTDAWEGNNLIGQDNIQTFFFVHEVSLDSEALPFEPEDYRSVKLIAKGLDYNDLVLLTRSLSFVAEKIAA